MQMFWCDGKDGLFCSGIPIPGVPFGLFSNVHVSPCAPVSFLLLTVTTYHLNNVILTTETNRAAVITVCVC